MANKRVKFDKLRFLKVANDSPTMMRAADSLGLKYETFIRYAKKFGVYRPNQSGKGLPKNRPSKYNFEEVLKGNQRYLGRGPLKRYLIENGLKEDKCEECGVKNWRGKELPINLHHKDGDGGNCKFDNLALLCPNCHSITDNWCKK